MQPIANKLIENWLDEKKRRQNKKKVKTTFFYNYYIDRQCLQMCQVLNGTWKQKTWCDCKQNKTNNDGEVYFHGISNICLWEWKPLFELCVTFVRSIPIYVVYSGDFSSYNVFKFVEKLNSKIFIICIFITWVFIFHLFYSLDFAIFSFNFSLVVIYIYINTLVIVSSFPIFFS